MDRQAEVRHGEHIESSLGSCTLCGHIFKISAFGRKHSIEADNLIQI